MNLRSTLLSTAVSGHHKRPFEIGEEGPDGKFRPLRKYGKSPIDNAVEAMELSAKLTRDQVAEMFDVDPALVVTGTTLSALEPVDMAAMFRRLAEWVSTLDHPMRVELSSAVYQDLRKGAAALGGGFDREEIAPAKTLFGLPFVERPDLPPEAVDVVYPDGRRERLR